MAKFDIESFRDYFLGLFQANLAAKVSEINSEKNDGITIVDIPAAQYFNDLNAAVVNYHTFIFYGFPEIKTTDRRGTSFSLEITMSVEVVISESEGGTETENKIMRYTRALAEIIAESAKHPQISELEIELFAPISLQLNLGSPVTKAGGINIKGAVA